MSNETEIERRFIVKSIDPDIFRAPSVQIEQGYVEKDLRVRIQLEPKTGTVKSTLTLKTGKGLIRHETNETISEKVADMLLDSTKYRLSKTRYMRDGWEIDVYDDELAGLVIAEHEFPSESASLALAMPKWIHDYTEVTETLTNRQLAKMAYFLDDARSGDMQVRDIVTSVAVPRIVLTGAPCSGKSTALARLKVDPTLHCVPETATIVLGQIEVTPDVGTKMFQHTIRRVQKSFEDAASQQALKNKKRAVILDRGTLDSAAFMGGVDVYEALMRTQRGLEFDRYAAVLLLELPSREIFEREKSNNMVRRETFEDAMRVQDALYDAWRDHPNFKIVRDMPTWDEKYRLITAAIEGVIDRLVGF